MTRKNIVNFRDSSNIQLSANAPVALQGVLRTLEHGDHTTTPSKHQAHELTYVRSGKMRYLIQDKTYTLKKGDLFVMKPNSEHTYVIDEGPADLIVVYFAFAKNAFLPATASTEEVSLESIDQFIDFVSESEESLASGELNQEYGFFLNQKGRERIVRLAERCVQESSSEHFAKGLMLDALAIELVVEVSRNIRQTWEESVLVKKGKARELVNLGQRFIQEQFKNNLSVQEVANYVFLSPSHFTRAFREVHGFGPMAYITKLRVEYACELLSRGDFKVAAVAKRAGFSSQQRFNIAFRKQIGMTPREYRQAKVLGEKK